MGEYLENGQISEVTAQLIDSYLKVTAEQVNKAYQEIFFNNQRRVNIKLSSQNHVMKTEDEECENLGGPEFKEEAEKS